MVAYLFGFLEEFDKRTAEEMFTFSNFAPNIDYTMFQTCTGDMRAKKSSLS